ncbi:hypothetical protein BLNAU_17693 [Blattamonas nauphoetae]|uniref:Uncharacterized protein n=1 Tax=Blattamonas nauphoetae TaxID=2049346 RepID=A0ABQ9X700_9EUKA|nr:hypothetical protein BLNAU_17693 [Blattamonas nauphoetae]
MPLFTLRPSEHVGGMQDALRRMSDEVVRGMNVRREGSMETMARQEPTPSKHSFTLSRNDCEEHPRTLERPHQSSSASSQKHLWKEQDSSFAVLHLSLFNTAEHHFPVSSTTPTTSFEHTT